MFTKSNVYDTCGGRARLLAVWSEKVINNVRLRVEAHSDVALFVTRKQMTLVVQ